MLGTAAVACTGIALGCTYGYAAIAPESQLFGRTLISTKNSSECALTYDDGPNDRVTFELLELLARYSVPATFFLIGSSVRKSPQIVRAIEEAGHLIGNHTMTHPMLTFMERRAIYDELSSCSKLLEDTLGRQIAYFRPPYGARRPAVLSVARELGLSTVMWNVVGYDWKPISSDRIERNLRKGLEFNQRRGVSHNILLHDGAHGNPGGDRSRTLLATERLLARYKGSNADGMRFVTPKEWATPHSKP